MTAVLHFIPGTMCTERLWSGLFAELESDFSCVHHPIPMVEALDATVDALRLQLGEGPSYNFV